MNRAKSKKVANITFPIVTNKVSTQEGLSVIETARQNVLAIFLLKNISDKLPLAASDLFSSPLAGGSSPVKVFSKRHTRVSPSVVSTTSKSPKIFNNRPVNKLVFPAFTTPTTTTTTTTALQMATKAKNSKKQQQAVATAMISTAAASPLPNMDGNSSGTSPKMGQDQLLAVLPDVVLSGRLSPILVAKQPINSNDLKDWADQMEMKSTVPPPVSGAANGSAWENVNGHQRFSGWVASNLVLGAIFKIKMALLGSLFQLLPGCIGLKSSLNGATKVAISDGNFLTTLKIAQSSGVTSVFFLSLLVVLCDISLDIFSDNIKTALGIFGVVTSVKLKPAGLWQYTVEVISSRDTFKAKLVNLLFDCTAFEISDLVSQWETPGYHHCYRCQDLNHLAVDCKKLFFILSKLSFNIFGGPKNFKPLFVRSKSYAKTAAFVVSSGAAAANMDLDLGGPPKTVTSMLSAVFSVSNTAVESRLASLEFHLSELSVLIKFLVESVSALIALVTKLLSTPFAVDVLVKKCVNELAKQNKNLAAVTICEQVCLENRSDVDDMVDNVNNNDNEDKNFSVYDNIFNVMMYLWKDQSSKIKSMAISDEVFLTTFKIAKFSGVTSVSSSSLSVALCNILLDTFSDDIKSALDMFGVITSVKLKPADIFSAAAAALTHWSVLVRKYSVRILPVINQNNVISSKNAFKAKLVNLFFGCIAFEISDLVSQVVIFDSLESLNVAVSKTDLNYLAVDCKKSFLLPLKLSFNISCGPKVFKPLFARTEFYVKAAALVVSSIANMNLDLSSLPKITISILPSVTHKI
ncbi:hypothetical protein G9A89_013962 [Geosiphon pyriformis]|nr:hypothetical protein G9A89_013962 [Geosiphon pyriformis]